MSDLGDYRYGDVERALVRIFAISETKLGAFRGRIRHLRRTGIPDLPQTGTGRQISYTLNHARELFLALRLNEFGVMPEVIGRMMKLNRANFLKLFSEAGAAKDNTLFLLINYRSFEETSGVPDTASYVWGWDKASDKATSFETLARRYGYHDNSLAWMVLNISLSEAQIRDALQAVRSA